MTETIQQSTFETTPQLITKITFQFEKKQISNQEKKVKIKRAFTTIMFDFINIRKKATKTQ